MADALIITDAGAGQVTLDNDPAPTQVEIERTVWESMVNGELTWATVTEDGDGVQLLEADTLNVSASFKWAGRTSARDAIMDVTAWTEF